MSYVYGRGSGAHTSFFYYGKFQSYKKGRLMLKRKLQYFGHLLQKTDSLGKTLMLGKIEGRRRRG